MKEITETTETAQCVECGDELDEGTGNEVGEFDRPIYDECEREVVDTMEDMGRPDWKVVKHHGPHIKIKLKECDECYAERSHLHPETGEELPDTDN